MTPADTPPPIRTENCRQFQSITSLRTAITVINWTIAHRERILLGRLPLFAIGGDAMKYDESTRTSKNRLKEAAMLGKKLHALRIAMGITQADAAARAGLSRSTAVLIEAGDESRTVTQILRYLDAISPRTTLLALLTDDIGAVKNMNANAIRKRVRSSSGTHVYAKSHTSAMAAETPSVKQVASAITTNKKADPYGF